MGFKHDDPCLAAAEEDEPLFILRANDELAPKIVMLWAREYWNAKRAEGGPTQAQIDKHNEALKIATAMRQWKEDKNAREKTETQATEV